MLPGSELHLEIQICFSALRSLPGRERRSGNPRSPKMLIAEDWRGRDRRYRAPARGIVPSGIKTEPYPIRSRVWRCRRRQRQLLSGAFYQLRGFADCLSRDFRNFRSGRCVLFSSRLFSIKAPKIPCCPPGPAATFQQRRARSNLLRAATKFQFFQHLVRATHESVMTPRPLSTLTLPASNCGLTSATKSCRLSLAKPWQSAKSFAVK